MTLPNQLERSRKFKLALRIGLPIFFLTILLIDSYFGEITRFLITTSIFILLIGVYFIFYLIYESDNKSLIDPITKTFDRNYALKYFSKNLKSKEYSIALIKLDNIDYINEQYGLLKGDKTLFLVAKYIQNFFLENIDEDIAISHFKGGDFLIGIRNNFDETNSLVQLLNVKLRAVNFDKVELETSVAVVNNRVSKNINQIIQRLYEIINYKDKSQNYQQNQNELELNIIKAVENSDISFMLQKIDADIDIFECSVKLFASNGDIIHQKQFLPIINRLNLAKEFYMLYFNKISQHIESNNLYAIKIDPIVIRDRNFLDEIRLFFNLNENLKNRVFIIFSEKEFYFNVKKFNSILNKYRELGINFVLDDVGQFQTSTLYLRDLDIDIIRFSQQYSKNLSNEKYRTILKGYIEMAKSLKINSWIKFVQNEDEYKIAKKLKIDYIQGKFINEGVIL
ncbi:MAG: EAL domain-containing protein [Campylobacterota bacterium]|nr:EAL domain-containing protein [Campylobacterota bacterium]